MAVQSTLDEYKAAAAEMAPVTVVQDGQPATGYVPTSAFVSGDYWNEQKKAAQDMYSQAVAANNDAAMKAQEYARQQAAMQKQQIDQNYDNTNRQLYRNYMANQKALPQQMAAQGYTGGLSETSRLRLMNAYGEGLTGNERSRAGDYANIDSGLNQTEYEANAAAASANAAALQSYQQALMNANQGMYQEQQQRADTLAAQGDFSGYINLGYTQDQVDYMTKLWIQQNPAFQNAWVDAHPEEAARLGIKKRSSGSGHVSSRNMNNDDEEEKEEPVRKPGTEKPPITKPKDNVLRSGSGHADR